MLIYNFQKEFLGIDEKDLQTLGYKDLAALRTEVTDFADLFVKTPGYIHNFKHVHWIDFITCAESNEESKVIINANSKSYRAFISITNAFLVDNPSQKAYLVHLNNLRALTSEEYENISGDITQKPTPQTAPQNLQIISPPQEEKVVIPDEYDTPLSIEEDLDQMLDVGDLSFAPQEESIPAEPETSVPQKEPQTEQETQLEPPLHVTPEKTYTFDPHIASKELGLPLDLIEEFLQDFIDQANDFKKDLYTALDEGDINNVKILSHKLKGVAANLRIEDAYEVLSIINASSDVDVIKTNLDDFYNIIAKLSGEEISDEDELTLEFKEEPKIEIEEESQSEPQQKYSKEKIANEIGLDLESFNELFDEFVNEAHIIFTKINDAVANNDYETVKKQALKLKGMSDNMRMHAFTDELETLIHSTDKEAISQALNKIDNVLTTIPKEED